MNGIINVYKEKGYTSHDVVAKMRGILKMKKIGHTGTLDPDAEGVLPVCIGRATKLCDMLTEHQKIYQATLLLGVETDTQDTSGKILREEEVVVTEDEVKEAIYSFLGEYAQIPPMYSALKVNGKKLYELAREGKIIEREPRLVEILSIEIEEINLPRVSFSVSCSKGTYIRTLCYDIGLKLGCGGCMETLIRTKVDRFLLQESYRLDQIEAIRDEGKLDTIITSIEDVFHNLKRVHTKEIYDPLVHNGNPVLKEYLAEELAQADEKILLFDSKGIMIGLYIYREEKNHFKPEKMFLGGN